MSQLLLVRHGQARFGSADYDRLSPVGERQARLVGREMAARGPGFDAFISGALARQQHTARLAAEQLAAPPTLRVDAAFDEYDAEALVTAYGPQVLDRDPHLAANRDALATDRRLFQRLFEQVMRCWLDGADTGDRACESWPSFRERVQRGLDRLRDDYPRDARLAVFSSGGPIAVAVAAAMQAGAAKTIELNWGLYNAGISELRSTRDGWRLLGCNDIGALRAPGDPALITFR